MATTRNQGTAIALIISGLCILLIFYIVQSKTFTRVETLFPANHRIDYITTTYHMDMFDDIIDSVDTLKIYIATVTVP